MKDCSDILTNKYNKLGYALLLGMTVILIGYSYYRVYNNELSPALEINWLLIHIIFAYVAYSAVFSLFILSIIRLVKHDQFFSVSNVLQLIALIAFSISFASGAIWAKISWGKYWTWDPKETWSLILLYVIVCTYTYSVKSMPNKVKYFIANSFQAAVVVMLFIGVCAIASGLHCYG